MEELLKEIEEAVYDGDDEKVGELVPKALDEDVDPQVLIQECGVKAMDRLGKDFDEMEVFLPELMLGGDCMKELINLCNEKLAGNNGEGAFKGRIVMGCAKGDLHDIGKSLVSTQLAISGFDVTDLGTDVAPSKFIDEAEQRNADIIIVSSLLTTSMYYMDEMISRLVKEGKRDKFKVAIGGGPVNAEYAEKIGADGYSRTANLAVPMALKLMEKKPGDPLVVEE